MQRTGIHEITFIARCESGLHIGGSQDELTIGGSDNPVIKNPATGKAYIPGSSLKGKMRHELEKQQGRVTGNRPCNCNHEDCPVCRVFGSHSNDSPLGPSRIIVRDGRLATGGRIESKSETAIDRQTGSAQRGSLRTGERVVEGSEFEMSIVLQVFDNDTDFGYKGHRGGGALQAVVAECLHMTQLTGLGGGVSRGSGAVSFHNFQLDGSPWTHWSA